jgi:hypothetical protein
MMQVDKPSERLHAMIFSHYDENDMHEDKNVWKIMSMLLKWEEEFEALLD